MASRIAASAICAGAVGLLAGCSSPFDQPHDITRSLNKTLPQGIERIPPSVYRDHQSGVGTAALTLMAEASPDEYVRYALYHSPEVEAAYQRWRAAAERLPQVSALPDPRANLRYSFMDDEAILGLMQSFPWPGTLTSREASAAHAAMAAWRDLEAVRLAVAERVLISLHELAFVDAAIRITDENLELIRSFEGVVRSRYRVGAGSHSELIRVQVELGQMEDRFAELRALRPVYVAELNAVLNRAPLVEIRPVSQLPGLRVVGDVSSVIALAQRTNPTLLALDQRREEQRMLAEAARKDGLPEFSVGIDYMFYEGHVVNRTGAGYPVMVTMGMSIPLWREKYDAGVREALARRLAVSSERSSETNLLSASIHRAWFEHTDAHRRVHLYEHTLIPKAEESLHASLAGFRAGETSFLDLLDTERTLLELAIAAERARADRGKALARLNTLVGEPVPTEPANQPSQYQNQDEVQP
ncbi:MAG: TolC family protein [Phycisphaerales bacterium]|nr:TolC family protein [Planctomycetota bacterium]MCH8507159.1 TolC family protein [Phycisphaerales bacterium]